MLQILSKYFSFSLELLRFLLCVKSTNILIGFIHILSLPYSIFTSSPLHFSSSLFPTFVYHHVPGRPLFYWVFPSVSRSLVSIPLFFLRSSPLLLFANEQSKPSYSLHLHTFSNTVFFQ